MNNEIEQLLIQLEYFIEENYKYYNNFELDKNQVKQLLDCITNLQQDNTMYAQLKDEYEEEIKDLQQENEELKKNQRYYKNGVFSLEYDKETLNDMVDDYKSRCEKAIKYIKENKVKAYAPYGDNEDTDYEICLVEKEIDNLLNILENGSEDK